MQVRESQKDKEFQMDVLELMESEWADYDDFLERYDSRVNPEHYVKRYKLWITFDELGYLVKKGYIDLDSVYDMYQTVGPIGHWFKWKPIILEQRKRNQNPKWMQWFEYLAEETLKLRQRDGLSLPEARDIAPT